MRFDRLLVENLNSKKRDDLSAAVYQGIINFTADRKSFDGQDLLAVINLMFDDAATTENRNKLLSFLLNSGRQIIVNQSSNENSQKLTADEVFSIYKNFALLLKPFLQHESDMAVNVPVLEYLLNDLSSLIPAEKLEDPLLNPDSIETQIEKAKKTVGSKERDIRFSKIASWLLSRKNRNETKSLRLAQDVANEMTDIEAKQNLSDFIKIVEIEKLIADKNLSDAERKSLQISSNSIKSWALMALGKLQEDFPQTSGELYDKSLTYLKKVSPSNYKTQLALILSSVYIKNDKAAALEVLAEAAKYSNQIKDDKKSASEPRTIFFSKIGDSDFSNSDLEINPEDIFAPQALGFLANSNWNESLTISQQIQPLHLRFKLQLQLANSVLQQESKTKIKAKTIGENQ